MSNSRFVINTVISHNQSFIINTNCVFDKIVLVVMFSFYVTMQLLNEHTQKYKETDCSDATKSVNSVKNRYSDRLPCMK